jgi:hypothetical protein
MLISQAIPCIMHLENRVGEKIITVLLAMAADNFQNQTNNTTLTTHFAQWKLPLNQKGDTICKVLLTNNKEWLFVDNIDVLVNHVFSAPINEQHKQIWLKLVSDYRDAMRILWKRIQLKMNDFFVAYVEESGADKEGVTNYIHMTPMVRIYIDIKTIKKVKNVTRMQCITFYRHVYIPYTMLILKRVRLRNTKSLQRSHNFYID